MGRCRADWDVSFLEAARLPLPDGTSACESGIFSARCGLTYIKNLQCPNASFAALIEVESIHQSNASKPSAFGKALKLQRYTHRAGHDVRARPTAPGHF